ncbi:hypothetical protein M8542_03035 [Amycolatopsis sp. OK19-0408]|uniref:Uncharacterized protein n=1 Tax=Amycolatopsis iheyensis TaxID=2945988 RepID=A0A9X2N4C2_9PSEU|nr:hypothetical protein [Amycolatopsis iheyensis]MCR6481784.1 hypothetical protein [Amycolatopsis iheyensis]
MAAVGLLGPACALATIGALALPWDVLAGWLLLGGSAGLLVAFVVPLLARGDAGRSGPELPVGLATAAAFVLFWLIVAGLRTIVGGGLTVAIVVLFVVAGLGAGYRYLATLPAAAEPAGSSVPRAVPVAEMATDELCLAWRRSYFLLLLAADLQARRLVVERRQVFLDEIERRDRSGFLRWLADGARAGGDPAPYLTTRT